MLLGLLWFLMCFSRVLLTFCILIFGIACESVMSMSEGIL